MKSSRFFVMRALLLAGVVCVTSEGCTSAPKLIESVTVRDADSQVVKVLSAAEIGSFEKLMREKEVVEASFGGTFQGRHYKLDVSRSGSSSGRWLYHTTGHLTVLSAMCMPVYRLRDPDAFNRLIRPER